MRTTAPKRRLRTSDSTASSRSSASSEISVSPSRVRRNDARSTTSISGNSRGRKCADHVFERDEQAAIADRDEPVEALRHLDAREALLAGLRIADEHAEAEREPGDVRERLARADRERRQHREDVPRGTSSRAPRRSASVRSSTEPTRMPSRGERGTQLVAPEPRLLRDQLERRRSRISASVCCAVRPSLERTARPETTWSWSPATRTMKNSSRIDETIPQNLHALEQRLVGVGRELEHAPHQVDLRQLAVEQGLARVGQGVLNCRHGAAQHPRTLVNRGLRSGDIGFDSR